MAESKPESKKFADRYQISPVTALYTLLKDYFLAIAGAAVFALLLRVYIVEAFRIPTDFMVPMLLPGDHILVNKLTYSGVFGMASSKPARGDVVIFTFPNDPTKDYIKRVVAVAGDT
ncbi:MAG: signal peptidase I, partial [Deltaproteobacteria bacterium]|nr:signal peptidase I [Deltaproteobacteria bacterium]